MSGFQEAKLDSASRELQSTYDPVYQATGTRAPQRVFGESINDYEARLLKPLMPHSRKWGHADLNELRAAKVMHVVRDEVFADAVKAATINEGPLRHVDQADAAGRMIRTFYGRPGAVWDRFKLPTRFVKQFCNLPPCF